MRGNANKHEDEVKPDNVVLKTYAFIHYLRQGRLDTSQEYSSSFMRYCSVSAFHG